ncbi:MAG: hypothetical protein AAFV53_04450 [Myxococcota bacterium]
MKIENLGRLTVSIGVLAHCMRAVEGVLAFAFGEGDTALVEIGVYSILMIVVALVFSVLWARRDGWEGAWGLLLVGLYLPHALFWLSMG